MKHEEAGGARSPRKRLSSSVTLRNSRSIFFRSYSMGQSDMGVKKSVVVNESIRLK